MSARRASAWTAVAIAGLAWSGSARADVVRLPPIASDFRARLAGTGDGAVRAKVVDGDRQLWLRADRGATVSVAGAEGEPLLRFDRRGVFVNVRSLTAAADRVGSVHRRVALDPGAPPSWLRLTAGHAFLWHDHRLHALEPLAQGRGAGVVGRWAIPVRIDGRQSAVRGDLVYEPAGPVWPWVLIAVVLAAAVWLGLALARSPAHGATIGAALAVTVVVCTLRIGRELYGRPTVAGAAYAGIGVTTALGILLVWALLQGNRDIRVFAALFAGLAALFEGLVMFRVLTHSIALSVLPTPLAKLAVAVALGLGAGLVGIVLRGLPEAEPAVSAAALAARR